MNSITILGRIGRDPEMRTTASGTQVLSFPVADSKKVRGEEKTTWYECSIFGNRAQSLQQYIRKGDQISVSGSHELQTWDKDDGSKGFKCAVMVNDVGLVNGSPNSQPANQGGFNQQPAHQNSGAQNQQPQKFGQNTGQPAPAPSGFADLNDDIPFIQFERGTFA